MTARQLELFPALREAPQQFRVPARPRDRKLIVSQDVSAPSLLGQVVLVIVHHADFDRRFLERRLPAFAIRRSGWQAGWQGSR
jgi:hypothetical protein